MPLTYHETVRLVTNLAKSHPKEHFYPRLHPQADLVITPEDKRRILALEALPPEIAQECLETMTTLAAYATGCQGMGPKENLNVLELKLALAEQIAGNTVYQAKLLKIAELTASSEQDSKSTLLLTFGHSLANTFVALTEFNSWANQGANRLDLALTEANLLSE